MALQLEEQGCELASQGKADVIVINTCAVTGEAQAKTRKAIRHAAGLEQTPTVVATGCVASLFADELMALAPGVIVEPNKANVPVRVMDILERKHMLTGLVSSGGVAQSEVHHVALQPTPTGRTRPGIKIQDGCDNRCTFCIVWKARGHSRSQSIDQVLREVRAAQRRGAQEVVLTGINLGNFRGQTSEGAIELPGLLDLLLEQTDVGRIRLSSIEPPDVTSDLLGVMAAAGERVAPFLHVCLQSGCDRTLRQMGRVYDTTHYAQMVDEARTKLPDIALGTDLIVGFPGESDDDFEESLAFCERMEFARMHVFRYSRRPGTPAANRPDQVPPAVIAARSSRMLEIARDMRLRQARARLGREELVVVQRRGGGVTGGLFDALVDGDAPIDSLVRVRTHGVLDDATLDCRVSQSS